MKIANTTIEVPLDIEVTDPMREPTAVTTVTQPLVVEGQMSVEQEVVRGPTGDIERTVQRRYPAHLFAVDVAKDEPEDTEPDTDDEDTEDADPGQNAA